MNTFFQIEMWKFVHFFIHIAFLFCFSSSPFLNENKNWKSKMVKFNKAFSLETTKKYIYNITTTATNTKRQTTRKTNFMVFSWIFFLSNIVLFMSLRYNNFDCFILKNNAFCVLKSWSWKKKYKIKFIKLLFFILCYFIFILTVFGNKCRIYKSWYSDFPIRHIQCYHRTKGIQL